VNHAESPDAGNTRLNQIEYECRINRIIGKLTELIGAIHGELLLLLLLHLARQL